MCTPYSWAKLPSLVIFFFFKRKLFMWWIGAGRVALRSSLSHQTINYDSIWLHVSSVKQRNLKMVLYFFLQIVLQWMFEITFFSKHTHHGNRYLFWSLTDINLTLRITMFGSQVSVCLISDIRPPWFELQRSNQGQVNMWFGQTKSCLYIY